MQTEWQDISTAPRHDVKLKEFARHWLNGPMPAALMADLADILEDEDYSPEKRAHQIVWQAIKYGLEHTPKKASPPPPAQGGE